MIRLLCIVLALATNLQAETYLFLLNRFGGIEIETSPPANVKFFQGNKQELETVYHSELMVKSPFLFMTPSGVMFQIEKLSKSVIHDDNRRINSGRYRLRISGDDEILAKIPYLADFATSNDEPMTFYGDKVVKDE